MFGAWETKLVGRLKRQVRASGHKWELIHSAVMAFLLAHSNRRTQICWPARERIAEFCDRDVSTVNRKIADFEEWGLIGRQQPRALSSQTFRPTQLTFLFPLAEPGGANDAQKCAEPQRKNEGCRSAKRGGAVAQNGGGAVAQNWDRNKEEARKEEARKVQVQEVKGEGQEAPPPPPKMPQIGPAQDEDLDQYGRSGATPEEFREIARANHWTEEEIAAQLDYAAGVEAERSRLVAELPGNWPTAPLTKDAGIIAAIAERAAFHAVRDGLHAHGYTQADFDERDWRKLQNEIARERAASGGSLGKTESERLPSLRRACARAGVSFRRANELYERMLA